MPYTTAAGGFERAGRLSHSHAVRRSAADTRQFYVPSDNVQDLSWLREYVQPRDSLQLPGGADRLQAVIAFDGSATSEQVRDGLPSVRYGFVQTGAAYLDLALMDEQRAERFVDPVRLREATGTSLFGIDLPAAGAYTRPGIGIAESWREALDQVFSVAGVGISDQERDRYTLTDLLYLIHGRPDTPATTVPVNCPKGSCDQRDIPVPDPRTAGETDCPACGTRLYPTDMLRIHEEVSEDGSNDSALGRLMSVLELFALVGIVTLVWRRRRTKLAELLFIVDGPLAVFGTPAKLQLQAQRYFQSMAIDDPTRPGEVMPPFICGIEKTGAMVDFATQIARYDGLEPGDLLVCGEAVIGRVTNSTNVLSYGKETYWGRKFVYRSLDGRTVVLTVLPRSGAAYDDRGGQPRPDSYPSLPAILDVIDRTGSSMYLNGIIPVALAHGAAAYPIGVGNDVLKLVGRERLGITSGSGTDPT